MQKHCIRILDVRQAALYVAHKMRWRCGCGCILMLFFASTECGAAHSKYCGKREHQCGDCCLGLSNWLKTKFEFCTKIFELHSNLKGILLGEKSFWLLYWGHKRAHRAKYYLHVSQLLKQHVNRSSFHIYLKHETNMNKHHNIFYFNLRKTSVHTIFQV